MKKTLNSGLIAALAMAVSTPGMHPGIWDILDPGLPDPNDDKEPNTMTSEITNPIAIAAIEKAEAKRLRKQQKHMKTEASDQSTGWPAFGGFRGGELSIFSSGKTMLGEKRTITMDIEATNTIDINDLTKIAAEDIEKEAEHIISTLDDYCV